jgi:hypothetical protein
MFLILVLAALWGTIVVLVLAICVASARGSRTPPPLAPLPLAELPAAPTDAEALHEEPRPVSTAHVSQPIHQLDPT